MTPDPLVELDTTTHPAGADMPPASRRPQLVDDPELTGDADEGAADTPLDDLRAELSAPVEGEPATLKVPGRPGYAVRYSVDLDDLEFQRWHRKASGKTIPGRDAAVDRLKLAGLVLAYQCEAIVRNGREVTDGGAPLLFRSPAFLDLMRRDDERRPPEVREAVRRFYGRDADLLAASDEVLNRAGYGDTAEDADEDPTQGR